MADDKAWRPDGDEDPQMQFFRHLNMLLQKYEAERMTGTAVPFLSEIVPAPTFRPPTVAEEAYVRAEQDMPYLVEIYCSLLEVRPVISVGQVVDTLRDLRRAAMAVHVTEIADRRAREEYPKVVCEVVINDSGEPCLHPLPCPVHSMKAQAPHAP